MAKKKGGNKKAGSRSKAKQVINGGKKSSKSSKKKSFLPRGVAAEKQAQAEGGAGAQPALNPYDVFQNRRRKKPVLGERHVKGETRNLARSRARAEGQRAKNIMQEKLSIGRTSKFKDNRLGAGLDGEEGQVDRLVKLRQKQAAKSFNLKGATSEELTIGGRQLSGMDDDELRADGAGSEDEAEGGDGAWDEKADPNDPIVLAKMRKAEQQKEKQEHENQLSALDVGFTDIMGELDFKLPKAQAPLEPRVAPDNYDQLVRRLGMERKAQATDRTKTAEELAREKADRLLALENAQRARAEGIDTREAAEIDGVDLTEAKPMAFGGRGAAKGPGGDDGMDDEEDGSDAADDFGMGAGSDEDGESGEGEESEEEADGESGGDAAEDQDEGASGEAGDGQEDEDDRHGEGCPELLTSADVDAIDLTTNAPGEEGLPFAPECPTNVRAVEDLLSGRSPKTALKLVQRVRATTAVAVAVENRAKLRSFFLALLEFSVKVLAREDGDLSMAGVKVVHALRPVLVDLAVAHPDEAHGYFAMRLADMAKTKLPKAADFACLKLITVLFPRTDAQHPVCTPAALLADGWAANLANLGASLGELASEGMLLWEILYQFCLPGRRFCTSFFQLGAALLEALCASQGGGRPVCLGAAGAAARLLGRSLRELREDDEATVHLAIREFVHPVYERLLASGADQQDVETVRKELKALLTEFETCKLTPLTVFETVRPQIKMLEPIFHEVGDRQAKGMEVTETKQLQRKLTKERRVAARQLARSASVLQQLQSHKDSELRAKRDKEKRRVRGIMEEETVMIKQMGTEANPSVQMDTSKKRYSAKKELKQQNKRVGGNNTDESKKAAKTEKAGKTKEPKVKKKLRAKKGKN